VRRPQDKHPFINNFCYARKPNVHGRIVLRGGSPGEEDANTRNDIRGRGSARCCRPGGGRSGDRRSPARAQAQDSGAQSGSSTGATEQGSSGMNQQGSAGQRQSGNTAKQNVSGGTAATGTQTQSTSRTTVREGSRGARMAVHSGGRTAIGVRHAGASEDIIIRRKKARRYVYHEPSTTVV